MKVLKWIGEKVYAFVNDNLDFVIVLAVVGIICAIVGHYGQMGFNLEWFLFFELPLYAFCGWALYHAYKIYKRILELRDDDNKKEC